MMLHIICKIWCSCHQGCNSSGK